MTMSRCRVVVLTVLIYSRSLTRNNIYFKMENGVYELLPTSVKSSPGLAHESLPVLAARDRTSHTCRSVRLSPVGIPAAIFRREAKAEGISGMDGWPGRARSASAFRSVSDVRRPSVGRGVTA